MKRPLLDIIINLPEGYSEGIYRSEKYGISKQTFNNGRSFKVFAHQLGGKDFISLNYYVTQSQEWLKPCEMPAQKVEDFLRAVKIVRE